MSELACDKRAPDPRDCGWCGEPVAEESAELRAHVETDAAGGVLCVARPWHRECGARSVLGGLNHLHGRCTCCGGTEPPDPPQLTRRQAALAAWAWVQGHTVPPIPFCDPDRDLLRSRSRKNIIG